MTIFYVFNLHFFSVKNNLRFILKDQLTNNIRNNNLIIKKNYIFHTINVNDYDYINPCIDIIQKRKKNRL